MQVAKHGESNGQMQNERQFKKRVLVTLHGSYSVLMFELPKSSRSRLNTCCSFFLLSPMRNTNLYFLFAPRSGTRIVPNPCSDGASALLDSLLPVETQQPHCARQRATVAVVQCAGLKSCWELQLAHACGAETAYASSKQRKRGPPILPSGSQ